MDERFCMQLVHLKEKKEEEHVFRGFIVRVNIISFHISEGEM